MRLSSEIANFFKLEASKLDGGAEIYLFGSRTDDSKRGGDIDIMILSKRSLSKKEIDTLRWGFYRKFGMQKLDLLNYRKDEQANFKEIVLHEAIKL